MKQQKNLNKYLQNQFTCIKHMLLIVGWGQEPRGTINAGGTQEMGEERAGNGISTIAGNEREIQKGKLLLFVAAYIQSMK